MTEIRGANVRSQQDQSAGGELNSYLRVDLPMGVTGGMVGALDDPVSEGKLLTFWENLEIITRVIRVFTIPTRADFSPLRCESSDYPRTNPISKIKKLTVISASP